jgi:hypothetical protein
MNFCLKDGKELVVDIPSDFTSKAETLILPSDISATHAITTTENKLICPDEWLHKIADTQKTQLQRFVLVERFTPNPYYLSKGKLYVYFDFSIFNSSIYKVSIPLSVGDVVRGVVRFKGEILSGTAKIDSNHVTNLRHGSRGGFRIQQWVNKDEATDIAETLKKSGNLFDFSELIITVKGSDEQTGAETAQLDLTRGMQNADLENEVIQLEALNSQHKSEISELQKHSDIIHRLSIAHGMALQADHIINFPGNTPLNKDSLKYLIANINSTLSQCLGARNRDDYFDHVPSIPDNEEGQSHWIRSHCSMLEALIKHQQQLMADKPMNES